jgi:quinol monooxygenase YgiN
MIHILAIVTTKPGKRAEVLDLVRKNAELVRAEDGCIEYHPLIDSDSSRCKFGGDTFVVVEKWRDFSALAAHRTAAHMLAYVDRTKDLIVNRAIYEMRQESANG